MDSAKIAYERVEGLDDVVRIPLANIKDANFVYDVLRDTFEACFQNGDRKFIIDLENVRFPSTALIALLIEVTSRARREGGDVKILNLGTKTLTHLNTFTPRNYLALESDESFAINEFKANHTHESENEESSKTDEASENDLTNDSEMKKSGSPADHPEEQEQKPKASIPEVDIVDDPFIEQLHDRYREQKFGPQKKAAEPPPAGVPAPGRGERNHLRVKSVTSNLYAICDFVTNYAERAGFDTKEVGKTKIAVYEACLNVIEHAYHSNPDKWIDVWIEYNTEMFKIIIQDYGIGFDGFSEEKYDVVSAMDERQTGGFGLYIIRRSMDQLDYRPDPRKGNRLTMIKFIK